MATILILATRYERTTKVTCRWARDLETDLLRNGQSVVARYGTDVGIAPLTVPPECDYIIFFGHGEPDKLIGQEARQSLRALLRHFPNRFFSRLIGIATGTLLDVASVKMLRGLPVYAVCCQASLKLGAAYGLTYPSGSFIGYLSPFVLSFPNANDFQKVVTDAAVALTSGASPAIVRSRLEQDWKNLAQEFFNGVLMNRREAFLAGIAAGSNSSFVSLQP